MSLEQWTTIKQIFAAAAELPANQRLAYLKQACGDNESLRREVESLLAVSEHIGTATVPQIGTSELRAACEPVPGAIHEGPGSSIGSYKILQTIGEGGFGTVYLAEQQHPVVRRVALKIVKLGMDTRQVIARFDAERQALAMMEHPNIAKVLDAGATDTGRPYFVMELVKGIPITEYCDQNNLSIRERMELLIPVCHAVQHAHQKGIIHRDIKPSNVLVTLHDGTPVPQVIDFGIAKAISQRLTDKTLFTEFKQMVGTPTYMSPEQAEFSGLDVDTRSDIYSLGVLMYELLIGATPFDLESLRRATDAEIQRMIREVEPPRPSTRLSTLHTLASVAARRRTEPKRLAQLVRGDLDWIVMKCLEKARTRRYETAEALARDIQHYLTHQPVTAGPPSKLYRFRKTVRRNRPAVIAGAVFVLMLSLSAIVSSWQAIRATRAERRADREAAKQLAVNQFLVEMLSSADPRGRSTDESIRGRDVTVVQVIDNAAAKLDRGSMKDQPEIEATLRATIGQVYQSLGEYRKAAQQRQIAFSLNKQVYGSQHPEIANSLNALGQLLRDQGRYAEAEPLLRDALAMQRKLLAVSDPDIASTLNNLALVLKETGNFDEAERLLREAMAINSEALGDEHLEQARTISNLAFVLEAHGKLTEAEPLLRQVLVLRRTLLGDEHPDVGVSLNNLGMLLRKQGKTSEAEPLLREALAMWRKQLGDEHPDVATSMKNIAIVMQEQGRLSDAEPLLSEALAIQRKQLGDRNPDVASSLHRLGLMKQERGKLPEAEALLREALSIRQEVLAAGHWLRANTASALGEVLAAQSKFDEAEPLLLSGYQGMRGQAAAGAVNQREAIQRIIALYEAWSKPDDATKWRNTLQTFDRQNPPAVVPTTGLQN